MNTKPLKNSPTATLALWMISAVLIFNIYFTQTSVAQKETLHTDIKPVVEKNLIPSLFPADLIAVIQSVYCNQLYWKHQNVTRLITR